MRVPRPSLRFASALLAMSGVVGCAGEAAETGPTAAPAERIVAVAAVDVRPRDLSLTLQVTGNIEPLRELRIAARMTGIVSEADYEDGQRVGANAVLARFDVAEQQAELTRAGTLLAQAEAALRRAEQIRARDLISQVEVENAEAAVALAQSEVSLWETRLDMGTVRAPVAGLVTQRLVEPGMSVTAGELLFVLADVSTLVVRVGVSDVYAPQLRTGQPVRIALDADAGTAWPGTIRRLLPAADPDTRLHTVEFAVSPVRGRTMPAPGYLARVAVDVDERPGVLAVPNESLLASSAADEPFVFVIADDRLERRVVVPGVSRRDWTEITEGLAAGEQVVGSNPTNLRDGMRVRVTDRIRHPSDAS